MLRPNLSVDWRATLEAAAAELARVRGHRLSAWCPNPEETKSSATCCDCGAVAHVDLDRNAGRRVFGSACTDPCNPNGGAD